MHIGNKSTAGKGIFLVSALVLMLSLLMVFAYQTDYAVNPDKEQYRQGEEVYIFVSGPGDTGFTVEIFDPEGDLVFEESGRTTGSGNGYLSCPGFSESGRYELILFFDGDDVAGSSFIVEESEDDEDYCIDCKQATTSTTTSSTSTSATSTSSTTSVISLTTATATTTVSGGTVSVSTSTVNSELGTTTTSATSTTPELGTTTTSATSTTPELGTTSTSTIPPNDNKTPDIETIQFGAEINKPVKWIKVVKNRTRVLIPEDSSNISVRRILNGTKEVIENITFVNKATASIPLLDILDEDSGGKELALDANYTYEIEYETPPPVVTEKIPSKYRKQITISSGIHYINVLAYTSITESPREAVRLYWIVNDSRILFEDINCTDTNNNSLIDQISWIIPQLSNQTFEVEITILNVQSYPTLGGNWTVRFNTTGTANLTITAVDGTTWSNVNEDNDLKFLEIKCGNKTLSYEWIDTSVFIENYGCNETGYETSKVLTSGKHHLEFIFGDDVEYAHNQVQEFWDSFEDQVTWTHWTETGEGDWTIETPSTGIVEDGTYVAHSDNCDSECTLTSDAINLSDEGDVTLTFVWGKTGLDGGEYLTLDIYDGVWHNDIWTSGTGTGNGAENIDLDASYNMVSNFMIRFRTRQSQTGEYAEFDAVNITSFQQVNWNQSTLNLGSGYQGAGDLTGSVNITSNGSNTDVNVTCDSGNCSAITEGWDDTTDMTHGQNLNVTFTCSDDNAGNLWAIFDVTSDEDSIPDQINVSCEILDTTSPSITNLQATPDSVGIFNPLNISANVTDNMAVDTVLIEVEEPDSTRTNYTAKKSGDIYYNDTVYTDQIGSHTYRIYANDTSNNTNNTESGSFTVEKATPTINLYLNGTDGDRSYYRNDSANFTVVLSVSGKTVELWTNLTGTMQLWDSGSSPLENMTKLDYGYGTYTIKGNFSGDENYTSAEEIHYLTISPDPVKPNITDVSPINQSYGLGELITIQANVTDNIAVDTVLVNITPPGGSPGLHVMVNNSPDIYQYTLQGGEIGAYYYVIIANDTSGNTRTYDPYIYVYGNATLTVLTEKYSHSLQENVTLIPGQDLTSDDKENGEIQKKAQSPGVISREFFDGFESGGITGNWTVAANPGTYSSIDVQTSSGCTSPNSGTYYLFMDVSSTNNYETNVIKTTPNFSGASNIILSFYHIETGEELHQIGDHSGDYDSGCTGNSPCGDGVFFTCDGNYWYRLEALTNNEGSWGYHEHNISADPDFCSEINESFAVKFMQHDNWLCTNDGRGFDDINISYFTPTSEDTEANTSYTNYTDVLSGNSSGLTKLIVTAEISTYNNSGSTAKGNNDPDLQLELYDGSGWVLIGNFTVNETGNVSLSTTNSTILEAWETAENTDFRIRGINFDYNDSSNIDEINWTGVWVTLYNGSSIFNTGSTNISGYLLMTVEKNGSWIHVDTVVNDTETETLRNISAGEYLDMGSIWNTDPWNTDSQPSGVYRVYAALVDNESNVLQGDDGNPIENYDAFEITIFGAINATPETVGYGQTVLISAEVLDSSADKVYAYIARPGEGYTGYEMTNISGTIYQYNYSDTWIWGNYSYYIWANNSAGHNGTSNTHLFYVRANATIAVQTENDTYGPNEDVNLNPSTIFSPVWWDSSWGYRKEINISNVGSSELIDFPAYLTISNESEMQSDYADLRFIINSTVLDYEIENYTASNVHVWVRIPNLSTGTNTLYMYYGNPGAGSGENAAGVWDNDHKGVWHLSEGGTNDRLDSTIHSNDLTPNNGVTHTSSGMVDGANEFDGLDDYMESVNNIDISGNTPRTITFWANVDDTTRCGIVGWGEDGDSQHYEVAVRTNHWFLWGWGGGNDWNTAVTPITDVWMHHAVIFDGSTVRWYVNGTELGSGFTHTYNTVNTHLFIAIEDDIGSIEYMDGFLDEIRISNVSRSLDWVNQTRQMVENQQSYVSLGGEEEYEIEPRASNSGSTNLSGYLEMRVERFSGGIWNTFEASFVIDRQPPLIKRNISSGGVLMLDSIWNPAGWDTKSNPAGLYRAFVTLTDLSGNTLKNDDGSLIRGWYNFTIISGEMRLSEIEHENNYTAGLDEYETGDNISWINVTVTNYNATSVNASITLNVLDPSSDTVSWGPQTETKYCGDLGVNESCERKFDNNTFGYPIPLTATSGGYSFAWNVTMASETGTTTYNNSITFSLHHIPDNLSSIIDPDKIFQNQSAIYNFTIVNPWSKNLTNLTVTINCPDITGMNCSCLATGLPYCNLTTLGSSASYTFSFNVSTNNTPAGDYYVNATLNYTNPGLEFHSWIDQQNQLLKVRMPGQFVEIISYPVNITRDGYGNLSGCSNNTLGSSMHNVTLNWTLPSGWSNYTGNLSNFDDEQMPGEMLWNNITAYVNISSELGPQTVELRADSQEGYEDWDIKTIIIYAETYITNLQSNESDPNKGDSIRISGRLILDNGTALSGRNVSIYDETDGVSVGSDLTDASGWFYVYYMIPNTASMGNHVLNATFDGLLTSYYLATCNTTNITVHDRPLILNVTDYPDPQGYGYNVTIEANVTDLEEVDTVRVCITPPSAGQSCYTMVNYTADIYQYNYTDTWVGGTYTYYIWANDSAGNSNQSLNHYFNINSNATLQVSTEKDTYGSNELVNLTNCTPGVWEDTFSDETKINASLSSNYDVSGGTAKLNETVYSTTYDFDSCTTETDCWAWSVDSNNYPPEGNPNSEVAATSTNYAAIAISGGTRWQLPNPGGGDYMWIRSQMKITQNVSKITQINFTGEGYGSATGDSRIYVCNVTANGATLPNCDSWIQIVQQQVTQDPPDTTVEGTLSSGFSDVINGSGYIYWVWGLITSDYLHVDYVKLDVEYTGYETSGNLTSTAVTTSNFVSWDTFQVDDATPSGTGLTYSILDATDNSVLCTITSAQASLGYGISSCAFGASSIRLYVDMTTTNTSNTPELYNWNVSWNNGSCMSNIGSTGLMSYLLMTVEKNGSDSWIHVETVINDSSTGTLRNVSAGNCLALDDIWNPVSWNTDDQQSGVYRVYAALTDPDGGILKNDDNSLICNTHEFIIASNPPVIQDVTATPQTVGYSYNVTIEANVTDDGQVGKVFVNITYPTGSSIWEEMTNISPDIYRYVFNDTWSWGNYSYYIWANDTWGLSNDTSSNPQEFYVRANVTMTLITENSTYNPNEQVNLTNSSANNTGVTNITSYLLMKVQRYSGGWIDVSTVVDNEFQNISSGGGINLSEIWLNGGAWDTGKHPGGLYRVYAELRDSSNNTLINDDSSLIYDTYQFNIASPIVMNITEIRIYNVTGLADTHSDGTLVGSGLNTTFNLYTSMVYRVEIVVNNTAESEDNWTISPSSIVYHNNLNPLWVINETEDTWYSNETQNFTGGNFSNGKATWNTSLGGMVKINHSAIFYYVVNLSNQQTGKRSVTFHLEDTSFLEEDYSTFNIMENVPPSLYNNIYGLNDTAVNRNESILAYARWDEAISLACAEYNSTSHSLENYTVAGPYTDNWTNYTIGTNSSWLLGGHVFKFYANDSYGNWNNTLRYLNFTVWGWSYTLDSYLSNYTIVNGSAVTMYCKVTSDNGSSPLSGYNVSFRNSTDVLGINQTNATGWASWTFIDNSLEYESITCNITDYAAIYYNDSSNNSRAETLRTIETRSPWYVNVTQNASKVHRGENISYSAYWYDDILLDYAWLESNETGVWLNNSLASPEFIESTDELVEFYATIPTDAELGSMGWRIHANDTSGNVNVTSPVNHTEIWGYAIISGSSLSPNPIYVNTTTTMSCRVVDYHNSSPINNYNVSFYSNESGYMGANQTNATGWASWTFNDTTIGWETLTCNITSDPPRYYDPHDPSSASKNLKTVALGEDTDPPGVVTYDLNASWIWKGQSIYAYAQWNEAIYNATIEYNSTSPTLNTYQIDSPYTDNWTNYTIETNSSWIVGIHYVKINAADLGEIWNNTLSSLNFTVRGRSKIQWHSPNESAYRGTVPFRCHVYDKDSGQGIGSYQVNFHNETWGYLGSNNTNSTGIAIYNWDGQNDPVGSKTFRCSIANSAYYNTTEEDKTAAGTFDLLGRLNVTIDYPADGLNFHRGETIDLNSSTKDENNETVSPTAVWYNSTGSQIATTEDTTWQIPTGYGLGPELIKVNVSKTNYDPDSDNTTIIIWGWSNISWISPVNGNYSQGSTIPLTCRVMDVNTSSGIQNYPVYFYYKNSTEAQYNYLETNPTNSSGHAVYSWDTTGLPQGNYTTMCNITDNASVYYNVTVDNEANTSINITTAGITGILNVSTLIPPDNTLVGQNKTFVVNATVTCTGGPCGDVSGTVRYNLSGATPDTAISTTPTTPFYIVNVTPNPQSCQSPLLENESCTLNWTLNATGALHSHYEIDVEFNATAANSNNTNDSTIEIAIVLVMTVSNYTLDFGSVEPSVNCSGAINDPITVTMDENSNNAKGIYIKGTDLTHGSNTIGVGNVTWSKGTSCGTAKGDGNFLSYDYKEVHGTLVAGDSIDTHYWVDIPPTPFAIYTGSMYIMANASY